MNIVQQNTGINTLSLLRLTITSILAGGRTDMGRVQGAGSTLRLLSSACFLVVIILSGLSSGCSNRKVTATTGGQSQPGQVPIPVLKSVDLGEITIDRSGPIPFRVLPKNATVKAQITDALSVQLRMYTVSTDVVDPFLVKNMVESPAGVWSVTIPSLLPQGVHINIWAEVMWNAVVPKDQTVVENGLTWLFLYSSFIRN